MSQLGVVLQESLRRERESGTSLGLLTEQMDAVDRAARRKRSLKERLGFTGIGCWGFRPPAISVSDEQHRELQQQQQRETQQSHEANPGQAPNSTEPDCVGPTPASSGMNLAAALAVERQFRGPPQEVEGGDTAGSTGGNSLGSRIGEGGWPGTPWRVSLMRLLEETEAGEGEGGGEKEGGRAAAEAGNDWVCCVCMGRKKGAAFIPCGHTYCRVCSRELWLNRGCCPLCNGKILEILDIF